MKSILEAILLGILFALAPATAWTQPPLKYNDSVGAVTDISGGVYNPSLGYYLPNGGGWVSLCPPTVSYGLNGGNGGPAWQTGRDGLWTTTDTNPLNTGGQTQTSYARADARGSARALATADVSTPCTVLQYGGPIFGTALGSATAQFYRRYTAATDPRSGPIDLNWSVQGSFSNLTTGGGGYASVWIYIVTAPPSRPVSSVPVINGSILLVSHGVMSQTSAVNTASCFFRHCPPVPKAPLIGARGTVDVQMAFERATGRPMTIGDSFTIGVVVSVLTRTCGDGACPALNAFTTDFTASATVSSGVELLTR